MRWSETIRFPLKVRDVRIFAEPLPEDWEQLLRQREQAGYLRGQQDGERALSQRLVDQRAEMASLQCGVLESLRGAVSQVIRDTEEALIALAIDAAQKVVAGMPVTREMVEAVVRDALTRAEDSAEVVVHLHPEDLEQLGQHGLSALQASPGSGSVRFVASAELSPGDCMVQTRFGVIDACRKAKFQQLQQSIRS
ncbi:MAG TPA: FliH/SctL family protein [Clostridia bacterium]|nr:FliH/SctL family protein [Clostridia bacterium]